MHVSSVSHYMYIWHLLTFSNAHWESMSKLPSLSAEELFKKAMGLDSVYLSKVRTHLSSRWDERRIVEGGFCGGFVAQWFMAALVRHPGFESCSCRFFAYLLSLSAGWIPIKRSYSPLFSRTCVMCLTGVSSPTSSVTPLSVPLQGTLSTALLCAGSVVELTEAVVTGKVLYMTHSLTDGTRVMMFL